MPLDVTKKLLELYNQKNSRRSDTGKSDEDKQLWSYRQAAAVLHTFSLDSIKPLEKDLESKNQAFLLYDDILFTFVDHAKQLYTLKPEIRKKALKRFSSKQEMKKALEANPDREMTPLQKLWEEYLRTGKVPDPERMGYYDLSCLLQMLSWIDPPDPALPKEESVQSYIRNKSVLAPFEQLVITNFTGREKELGLLRKHIEATSPGKSSSIFEQVRGWFNTDSPRSILSIFGPGGIGKSALVGRMLWLNTQSGKNSRNPFAYLAFDQPTLRIESPFTLLVEVAAQLELQCPNLADYFRLFNRKVMEFREEKNDIINRKKIIGSRSLRIDESVSLETNLYYAFTDLLDAISKANQNRNVILVFDTFEEVQYRDREHLNSFWNMLEIILAEFNFLRIIITSRAPIADLGIKKDMFSELQLEELSMPERLSLLKSLQVTDTRIAQSVAQQIGGNPLSLRLAANLVVSDMQAAGTSGIKDLTTKKWLFFQVDEEIIQGQLYRRILDHIHDPNVRKLAHPGMVLRRITPEVILEVLAPVSQIDITDIQGANHLFDELKRERALVKQGDNPEVLLFRPEIRQVILRLIGQDKFSEVRELHRKAISYYAGHVDPVSRAEEFYHRLVLDEDDDYILDERWIRGIEQLLVNNMDEYSDRMKIWLGSRAKVEIPKEVRAKASIADWERNITRKVKFALKDGHPDRALMLLGERKERSAASPLYSLEAKAYLVQNNLKATSKVLDTGIENLSRSANRGRLAELFWLQSQVQVLEKNYLLADGLLAQAERAIEYASSKLAVIHVLCHRLLLRKYYTQPYNESVTVLRNRLNTFCDKVNEDMVYTMEFILPLALSLLENEFPQTINRLEKYTSSVESYASADMLTSENLRGLNEFREDWEKERDDNEQNMTFEALA